MESRIHVNYSQHCKIKFLILNINFILYGWINMESRNHVLNYSPYINYLSKKLYSK